jgi:hypothetical protein
VCVRICERNRGAQRGHGDADVDSSAYETLLCDHKKNVSKTVCLAIGQTSRVCVCVCVCGCN